jgi:hypothetical protein
MSMLSHFIVGARLTVTEGDPVVFMDNGAMGGPGSALYRKTQLDLIAVNFSCENSTMYVTRGWQKILRTSTFKLDWVSSTRII